MGYSPAIIANYFLDKAKAESRSVTPMQLIKLVYIAHGWHLGYFQKPLINEAVQAWKYGPVIKSLYHSLKHYGNNGVSSKILSFKKIDTASVTAKLLNSVWDKYKHYSGLELSSMTHSEGTPWFITWNDQGASQYLDRPINNNEIQTHYIQKINNAKARAD